MGQKHNQPKKTIRRENTVKSIHNNLFDDAIDLENEAEAIKIGKNKNMICPYCKKSFKTTNQNEIQTWVNHKRSCKKKNGNKINNKNNINNINNQNHYINTNNNNIFIVPPPPPPPPPPPLLQYNRPHIDYNNYNSINNINIPQYRSNIINPQRPLNRPMSQYQRNPPNQQSQPNIPRIRVNANNQDLNNIINAIGLETKKVLPRGKKDGTFEEKVDYLRFDISKNKIDFINGAENLKINRDKVLEESMTQFETINLFKELKIIFIGEESHDAGGLIREWLTILFQKILDRDTGLFQRSDTDEVGYIIKPNLYPSQDLLNKYFFIGRVLAKALLENLTVNCCFNKVIYQLILGEKIELNDLVFIDRPLYKSMKHLVSMKEE